MTAMRLLLFPLLGALLAAGCASKLDRDLTDKAPRGSALEAELDLDDVVFRGVADGAPVKLGEAMRANGLRHVLLVFGSRGCAICNKEAQALQNEVIGRHQLFFTSAGRSFQVVGVNTDGVLDARLRAYLAPLPFIQWNDPAGAEMLAHFMPPGRRFAVPLSVLVRAPERGAAGIVWRVLPEQAAEVDVGELMLRVEAELRGEPVADAGAEPGDDGVGSGEGDGGGAAEGAATASDVEPADGGDGSGGEGGDGGGGDGSGADGSGDGVEPARARTLGDALPGRLDFAEAKACGGEPVRLGEFTAGFDMAFVQTARTTCDAACRELGAHVQRTCAAGLPGGKTCRLVRLTGTAPEVCEAGVDFTGGAPFYDLFATHFNWAYRPIESPDFSLTLPSVEGSLLLGFAKNGTLVVSHEGPLAADAFDALVAGVRDDVPAKGPAFRFYDKARGELSFAELRRAARYTIVNSFSTICGSCITELKHWSAPGNVVDFCAARPGDCQIVAVERTDGVEQSAGLAGYYDDVMKVFASEAIRVPMLLDPTPVDDYLARYFDGYVCALKPAWGGLYGTLVYDREGKIVASFDPADEAGSRQDEALEFLRKTLREGAQ
jgi:hypothetical protein